LPSDLFLLPPCIYNAKNQERKVGFEIEFSGLKIDQIALILQDIFKGSIQKITPFKYKVITPEYGAFGVELDFRFLKEELLKEELEKLGLIDADDVKFIRHIEELIATISETVVPYEIATPPLPVTQLPILDVLEEVLRQRGALGTGASFLYAFGLHINPEVPSFEVTALLRYLRAFFVLYEWLVYTSRTDFIRRLTPYITPFDNEYTKLVLDSSYNPDMNRFIDDYLYYNPTRNRPLDLLPLFKFIDKERVEAVVDDPRIKERPTFHYRLPDCRIDTEIHNIAHAWNRWIAVERLAEDEIRLNSMVESYLEYLEDPFSIFEEDWAVRIEKWHNS
jgi:hypothetical protein